MPHSILSPEPERERCAHPSQELRRRQFGDTKTRQYVMQCTVCGRQMRAISKDDPAIRNLSTLPPEFDTGLAERYWQETFAQRQEVWRQKQEEQREAYRLYLLTPTWRGKRAQRLEIDRYRCQARLSGCLGTASEVHHLTYDHCGDEAMFDLASVCRPCHERLTEMEGRGREARHDRAS